MITHLTVLPVELFHEIFDYLSTYDMCHAFHNINIYIDGVLRSYSHFKLDFQSIPKSRFDLLCQYARSAGIEKLRLCDNLYETPGQSELFLSYFNIEQLINVRTLSLIQVEDSSLVMIFDAWTGFKRLSSLTLIRSVPPEPTCLLDDENEDMHLPLYLIVLETNSWQFHQFVTRVLPHLQYLTLHACSIDQLQCICQSEMATNRLKSLDIVLVQRDQETIPSFETTAQDLTRLKLRIQYIGTEHQVTFSAFERFLSKTPNLTYLNLKAPGNRGLANGMKWANFITTSLPRLCSFEFYFCLCSNSFSNEYFSLDSFRTPFWLEFKRWYVAWDGSIRVYTVADRYYHVFPSYFELRTTSPEGMNLYYSTITYLKVYVDWRQGLIHDGHYDPSRTLFTNIRTLELDRSGSFFQSNDTWYNGDVPSELLKLAPVRHLICNLHMFLDFLFDYLTPNLCELTLRSLPQSNRWFPLYSIRTLRMKSIDIFVEVDDIDRMCSLFPCLEHLQMGVYDQYEIVFILNRLTHLCSATFAWHCKKTISFEWICTKTRLTKNNSTYRIQPDIRTIHFWINNQTKETVMVTNDNKLSCCWLWPRRRKRVKKPKLDQPFAFYQP